MKRKLILLIIVFWIGLGMSLINKKNSPESTEDSFLTQKRNEYIRVNIEKISDDVPLTGINPSKIALAVFGLKDDVEGNFQEKLTANVNNPNQVIVTLTQMGLPDDSIQGIRYRIEFIPQDDQWHLVWAGYQQICWPGRGSQDWNTEQCF